MECMQNSAVLCAWLGRPTLSSKSPASSAGRFCLRLGAVLLQSTIWSTPPAQRQHPLASALLHRS